MEDEKLIRVYDFDKTIYSGDSTIDFYKYVLKKHPKIIVCLPVQCFAFAMMKLGFWKKERAKSCFFFFLRMLSDVDGTVKSFWDKNISQIKPWYLAQKSESDVIITASPNFLVCRAVERLGKMTVIASDCDKKTGKYLSKNCYGEEKVKRFRECCGDAVIEEFYSDSLSDLPMAKLSKRSFIVKGDAIIPWQMK